MQKLGIIQATCGEAYTLHRVSKEDEERIQYQNMESLVAIMYREWFFNDEYARRTKEYHNEKYVGGW